MEKINVTGDDGVFLGVRVRSSEILVGTKDGIKLARSVRRIPEEDRWTAEALELVKWVPWRLGPTDAAADGEVPAGEGGGRFARGH